MPRARFDGNGRAVYGYAVFPCRKDEPRGPTLAKASALWE